MCTDLSTLASVVTTLATMGKDRDSSSTADTSDDVPNGDMSSAENTGLDQAAKAFDALAKALQPQLDQVRHAVFVHQGFSAVVLSCAIFKFELIVKQVRPQTRAE